MNKDIIRQLQILEQSLNSIHSQKQQFQAQVIEVESAISELDKTNTAYKIIGNIMVASDKKQLLVDLKEKKELFASRVKVLETQEKQYREQATKVQEELMKDSKK